MTTKEIQELIKLINKTDLSEVKLKNGDFELQIRTKHHTRPSSGSSPAPVISVPSIPPSFQAAAPAPAPAPAASPSPAPGTPPSTPAAAADDDESKYLAVKSPMVGTFYRSSSPDKPVYAKVGDVIEAGSVVCIVEAMKLFNEIESEVSGKVVKVMVEDAQPVEYDQVLFLVDPNG